MPLSSPPAPYTVRFDSSGANAVVPNNLSTYILNPAAPVSALTLTLPAIPFNGQTVDLCTTQTITTLTVASTQTVLDAFAAQLLAGDGIRYRYNASTTTWFRLH
jgi:hypothetical protein